ncbi:MAG: NADP-dependent isocitrate dehydrogenase [bacterium]|nr:NADP-dependent isocitrate dehydrogenase [bacterium]
MTDGQLITIESGTFNIPDIPIIPFIAGDGIGPEIWDATRKVIDTAVEVAYEGTRRIEWLEVFAGKRGWQLFGDYLPPQTLATLSRHLVGIKGPLATPVSGCIRSLNIAIRRELDLYACIRPVRYFNGAPSPLRNPQHINIILFRESSEDTYAGIEFMTGSDECTGLLHYLSASHLSAYEKIRFPDTCSIGIKPVSREGTERIVRVAVNHAIIHDLPSVTIVHQGNVMKCTEGAFCQWAYELIEKEFGAMHFGRGRWLHLKNPVNHHIIEIKDVTADVFFEQILTHPTEHSVVVTLNMNGDYISEAISGTIGGLGIAPGANLNLETGRAIFEATHGTAPDIAGLGQANPCGLILSAVLMLRYITWDEAADLVVRSLKHTLIEKTVTSDFFRLIDNGRLVSTSEFAEHIMAHIMTEEEMEV